MREKVLPCPFCGAHPHHGLTKIMHCQLHGDPYQNFRIWCPHKCAQVECGDETRAAKKWNTRVIEADRAELVADVFAYLIAKAQEPVEIFTGSFAKPLHADERTAWLKKMQKEYNEGNA